MGWFHKSLTDMQDAIGRGDWVAVRKVLEEHCLDFNRPLQDRMTHEIREAKLHIDEYFKHMSNVSALVDGSRSRREDNHPTHEIKGMLFEIEQAKSRALQFEKLLRELAKQEKFME